MNKKSINNFKKTNYWKNLLKNRNSISPLIAISLLIVVVIIAVIGYQGWYNNYSSTIMVHTETTSNSALDNTLVVEDIVDNTLYVINNYNENVTLDKISIDGNDCALNQTLEAGIQSVDVSDCLVWLNDRTQNVVLYTNDVVVDEVVYLDSSVLEHAHASISSFSSNASPIDYGDSIRLSWSSSNSKNCTASGGWSGLKSVSGSDVISNIDITTSFYLVCDGIYGNSSTSAVIVVVGVCPVETNVGLCKECDGIGGFQMPADDSGCGTIDCDGLDEYWENGSDSATGTNYCEYDDYTDISSNRCEALSDCKDPNSGDCGSASSTATQATAGVCKYITGCTGSTIGTVSNYGSGTDTGTCRECDGSGSEQMPADDSGCGTIDCDGLNYYFTDGSASVTGTNYCKLRDFADLVSGRCEGLSDCKDPNSGDCTSYSDSTADTCGTCEYATGACSTCTDYSSGTDSGLCRECDGSGGEQTDNDDSGCGTIDCDGLDNYWQDGSDSATGTNYCKLDNYADLTSSRCEGLSNCKDANTADCGSASTSTQATAGICKYISGCAGSTIGTVSNYGSGTDSGTCRECDGSGGEQMPSDDSGCGTIDCDGLDSYVKTGTQHPDYTSYCHYYNYADITTNRCEGIGDCKDANTADCTSFSDTTTVTAGICKFVSGCEDSSSGTLGYFSNGYPCDSHTKTCDGAGHCT